MQVKSKRLLSALDQLAETSEQLALLRCVCEREREGV
jgi:hypothetical protein